MKILTDLAGLIQNIAYRKDRAEEARKHRADTSRPAPSEVFESACREIAGAFASEGFRFLKTKHYLVKDAGELQVQIAFQTSHNNVRGEYVSLAMTARVVSARLKQWREAHPIPGVPINDAIAVADIGNLRPTPVWLEWNLAQNYDSEVRSIIRAIGDDALPYFSFICEEVIFVDRIQSELPTGVDPVRAIEYSLCFVGKEVAENVLSSYLRSRPDLLPGYRASFDRYRQGEEMSGHANGYAVQLARASVTHGLNISGGLIA